MTKQDMPALILVDIQKGFEDLVYWGGHRNNPDAETNAGKLLEYWRQNNFPVFHIKHCSSNPNSILAEGHAGNEFKDVVKPYDGEPIIKKNVNSAFIGTDLKHQLDSAGIKNLVIAGLTTDHCISTTVRMSGNFGYNTYVISDATATFDKNGADGKKYSAELIHETALASLNNEFATVINTDDMIYKINIQMKPRTIISVEAIINLPIEKVWKLWTCPDDIVKWNYASDDWHTPLAENDLRVGGKFLSRMEARDGSMGFDFEGIYTSVKNNELIEYVLADDRRIRIEFSKIGNKTKVVERFDAEEINSPELQRSGWQSILNNFKAFAEQKNN